MADHEEYPYATDPDFAPWEKVFERVYTPFEDFMGKQITRSLILMACTVTAIVIVNSAWAAAYHHGNRA